LFFKINRKLCFWSFYGYHLQKN